MKNEYNMDNWDLIAKYYSNECSQYERDELMNWLKENQDNKILFDQVKQDLEIINLNKSMNKVNENLAWEKVKNRIQEDNSDLPLINDNKIKIIRLKSVMKVAAVMLMLLSIGFVSTKIYKNILSKNFAFEYAAMNEQGKEVRLPDGTLVTLNSESKLTYPKAFALNERKVVLEGEAFFDVTKNPDLPFIITSKNAEVRVLGTSFNVNANLPDNQVEVFVKTGQVQLLDTKDETRKVLINPGDVGVLNHSILVKSTNKNENIISWKTKEIVFKEQSLSDVFSTLNKIYKTKITSTDQNVLNLRLTSTFRNQEIGSILNVICTTFDLKTDSVQDEILLKKRNN